MNQSPATMDSQIWAMVDGLYAKYDTAKQGRLNIKQLTDLYNEAFERMGIKTRILNTMTEDTFKSIDKNFDGSASKEEAALGLRQFMIDNGLLSIAPQLTISGVGGMVSSGGQYGSQKPQMLSTQGPQTLSPTVSTPSTQPVTGQQWNLPNLPNWTQPPTSPNPQSQPTQGQMAVSSPQANLGTNPNISQPGLQRAPTGQQASTTGQMQPGQQTQQTSNNQPKYHRQHTLIESLVRQSSIQSTTQPSQPTSQPATQQFVQPPQPLSNPVLPPSNPVQPTQQWGSANTASQPWNAQQGQQQWGTTSNQPQWNQASSMAQSNVQPGPPQWSAPTNWNQPTQQPPPTQQVQPPTWNQPPSQPPAQQWNQPPPTWNQPNQQSNQWAPQQQQPTQQQSWNQGQQSGWNQPPSINQSYPNNPTQPAFNQPPQQGWNTQPATNPGMLPQPMSPQALALQWGNLQFRSTEELRLKEAVDRIYLKYDANHSGSLEPTEAVGAFNELMVELKIPATLNTEQCLTLLSLVDRNKNGRVEKPQFFACMKNLSGRQY